jgi:hypothetical protein
MTGDDANDGSRGDEINTDLRGDGDGIPSLAGDEEFAYFENPRSESVAYHVSDHWHAIQVTRFGDATAETQNLLLRCDRCEVRYWLEDVPAERVPGTRKYEQLRS